MQAIMAIANCSSNKQQQPQKAPPAKMPTHRGGNRRSDCHLDKSPKTVNINAILANINLPQTRFETILIALSPATNRHKETEENPVPPGHYAPTQLMWLSGRLMLLVAEVRGSIPCKTPRLE